jgi:dCTP deaminase
MVLSAKEILKRLHSDLTISPITNGGEQIGNSSIDVRLGSIFRYLKVVNQTHFDITDLENLKSEIEEYSEEIILQPLEPFILHPKDFVLGSTLEYLKFPLNLTARLEGRSTWGRVGLQVHSTAGLIDPGFEGSLTFELHNLGKLPLPLFPGTRIGQLVFYNMENSISSYKDKDASKFHSQLGPKNSSFYKDYDYKNIITTRNRERFKQSDTMNDLNDQTIELITSEDFDENFWLFELGKSAAAEHESLDVDNQFMSSFFDNGKKLWEFYKNKVQDALCDKQKNEPKEFVQEITSGNIKDIVVNVISLLTTTYSISLAIAIPLCSLALKKGIHNICKGD